MDSYVSLSKIYDLWQEKNDPSKWADHVEKIIAKHCRIKKGDGAEGSYLLLDLGCGTGGFAIEMANRGYDVLGMDLSSDMLAVAREKDSSQQVQFIQQDMTRMELFGTVDLIVCFLDTVNHVLEEAKLNRLFRLCKNYLNPDGLLIFDLATPHYFEQVLGNQMFFDIRESYTLTWQNTVDLKKGRSRSELTFFIRQPDGSYLRGEECINERIYSVEEIESLIQAGNLTILKQYDGLSFRKPSAATDRILFIAENRGDEWKKSLETVALADRGAIKSAHKKNRQKDEEDQVGRNE
jgi:SAM-dependent methyltransferase